MHLSTVHEKFGQQLRLEKKKKKEGKRRNSGRGRANAQSKHSQIHTSFSTFGTKVKNHPLKKTS